MKKILDMISTLKKDNKTIIEYINSFKQIPKTYELFQNNPDFEKLKDDKKNIDE